MKRKFWIGASFSALVLAAMAPWSASQANGVSVRVSTPEFGIRIGAPHFPIFQPVPVYRPVPIYRPRFRHVPPPVIYAPPPRWGYGYAGYRGHGHYRHWQRQHWQQHRDHRHDRYDRHRGR